MAGGTGGLLLAARVGRAGVVAAGGGLGAGRRPGEVAGTPLLCGTGAWRVWRVCALSILCVLFGRERCVPHSAVAYRCSVFETYGLVPVVLEKRRRLLLLLLRHEWSSSQRRQGWRQSSSVAVARVLSYFYSGRLRRLRGP